MGLFVIRFCEFFTKTADLKFVVDKIESAVYNAFYRQRSTVGTSVFEGKQIFKKSGSKKRPDIVYFYSCCIVHGKIQIMTEKQYKGIAGNFLICDVQKEYAEHLLSILVKRFGMRFQFHFFSNVKKIEQFAEKQR